MAYKVVIQATANHRFWNAEQRQWITAGSIRVGTVLQCGSGPTIVTRVSVISGTVSTYNLEVEGIHTYLVGSGGFLVHNGDSGFASPIRRDTRIYRVKMTKDDVLIGRLREAGETVYIGKTYQGGPGDVLKRFAGHLSAKKAWSAIEGSIEPELLREGEWTSFETACWEQHFIELNGGVGGESPLINIDNALDPDKFEEFKDGYGHNPCGG